MKSNIKFLLLIILGFILSFSNVSSAKDTNSNYELQYVTPGSNSFEYYFEDAYWRQREYKELGWRKAWCLTLIPNRNRSYGIFQTDNEIAWSYVVARFSNDYRWNNESIMRRQFMCHCRYARYKSDWNIEPWRTSMNPVNCN